MKQILQNLGNGETLLAEVPAPRRRSTGVLISSTRSLVSLGTEKMLIDFGKGNLLSKAKSQPDKVKQVLQKIKTDGLFTTIDAVKAKLDTPIPLGYCNVGRVIESNAESPYSAGDRVVSNGHHAEIVSVGEMLTAAIPNEVDDDQASFAVVGAIGLQGIRLLQPTLGEYVVVSGLGLIGQMTVQMLVANGCKVLGIDFDRQKLELAARCGAEICDLSCGQNPVGVADAWTNGRGVDGVIITASTKSDELIHQAATMCRQRGRIVLVGVIGLNLQRADFYEKELSFQVSCSYGPGRYDPNYEGRGLDYPIGFVRWTEKRNFEAVLQLLKDGRLDVAPLITHRFAFDNALEAYEAVNDPTAMGIILQYSDQQKTTPDTEQKLAIRDNSYAPNPEKHSPSQSTHALGRDLSIAFIGAGGFSTRMLMPLLPTQGIRKYAVASGSGVSSAHAKKKFGFEIATSDADSLLADSEVDAVLITTPHNLHASMVCEALERGKHVFVEKPLAMNHDELTRVKTCADAHPDQYLMVGFNRRFSPHMKQIKQWAMSASSNKSILITVNAGAIPEAHWTQDPRIGGGRIVGEACHFVDTARYLANSSIESVSSTPIQGGDGRLGDCVGILLGFADGSYAAINYLSNGHKSFPKERIEVFCGGQVYICDNFRKSWQTGGNRSFKTRKQDKGHENELREFFDAIRSGDRCPITRDEIFEVMNATISARPV